MSVIQYSGNVDDPESFTMKDMERLIKAYNNTIDAILFIVNYAGSNKAMFDKTIVIRGLSDLGYCDQYPYNALISCVGMANDLHKKDGRGSYEPYSSLASLKIRNESDNYENKYKELLINIGKLQWSFQDYVILAFDKLYADVKKFKSKYKNVIGVHKILKDLDKCLNRTVETIGFPEIEFFNGNITKIQAITVSAKLSANQTPISPLHLYRDIMRFETVKEMVQNAKREHSRQKHYDAAQHELDTITDQNIELAQTNYELAQKNSELQSEKQKLIADNEKMAKQIANMRRSFVGRILFNLAQRKK